VLKLQVKEIRMLEPDEVDLLNIVELRRELRHALQCRTDTEQETFPDIRAAMRALQDAKALRCICTGFVIQYEGGCCCAHGKAVKLAKDNLKQLLEAL